MTYVSLTSPPAALYALPVERWYSVDTAATMNFWFLAIVAAWRVGLYGVYLRRAASLGGGAVCVATLLPLMGIVTALSILNLERAVFEIMGGLREQTANDAAYSLLLGLTLLSVYGVIPVLIAYGCVIIGAHARLPADSEAGP